MSISFAPSCIMRCASAGVTDVIVIGSVLLAVELIERGEQHLGPGVSDPVPERLALATEGYEPLVTHLRQLLRQGRLREADVIGEIADRALRSAARRVGKVCVGTCRTRWSPYH